MTLIVTHSYRPERAPRKKQAQAAALTVPAIVTHAYQPRKHKAQAAAITGPTIVTVPSKWDRLRRREEADQAREVLPEDEAAAWAFIARMMQPR